MSRIFAGNPPGKIQYEITTRGKLVFHLVNGKYITFTKEELGTLVNNFQVGSSVWSQDLMDPFKTKVLNAGCSAVRNSITQVIDRGNLINSFGEGSLGNSKKLTRVILPKCKSIKQWCFWNDEKLMEIYLPIINFPGTEHKRQNFVGCTSLEKIDFPGATQCISFWDTFDGCSNLKEVNMNNLVTIEGWMNGERGMFNNCQELKKLILPRLRSICPAGPLRLGVCGIEEIDFPMISSVSEYKMDLSSLNKCTKAIFGQIPLATIKSNNAWGLPNGCHIFGKDGDYIKA